MAKKESGFIHWYESYQGKKVTGIIYSAGASVVIIGALFKIMHFPGAGPVLMTGMITESLLFMIGVLDKPHQDFHWENVFPQVCGYGTEPEYLAELQNRPRPTLLGAGSEDGAPQPEEKKKANVPALSDKDMEALKEGIDGLAKTAVQLQDLGKVAVATNKLGEKMEAAGEKMDAAGAKMDAAGAKMDATAEAVGQKMTAAAEAAGQKLGAAMDAAGQKMVAAGDKMAVIGEAAAKFAASSDAVTKKNEELGVAYGTIVTDMQGVVAGTKNLQKGVDTIGAKLSSLNSVYELQLAALQAQVDSYKAQTAQVNAAAEQVKAMTADVQKMQASIAEATKDHAAYEASAKKLAQQVADLNKVYGNMLNALA